MAPTGLDPGRLGCAPPRLGCSPRPPRSRYPNLRQARTTRLGCCNLLKVLPYPNHPNHPNLFRACREKASVSVFVGLTGIGRVVGMAGMWTGRIGRTLTAGGSC